MIVACPNCGKKISDSAKECVYCGSKLVKCPKCKNLQIAGENICKSCGQELPKPEAQKFIIVSPPQAADLKDAIIVSQAQTDDLKNIAADLKKFKQLSSIKEIYAAKKRNQNLIKAMGIITLIATSLLILWEIYKLNNLINSENSLLVLLEEPNLISNMQDALIISCYVSGGISIITGFIDGIEKTALCNWMEQNKIDPVSGTKSYLSLIKNENGLDSNDLLTAAYYCANPHMKKLLYLDVIAAITCEILVYVGIVYHIIWKFISPKLEAFLLETSYSFTDIIAPGLPYIAIGIIIAFIFSVVNEMAKHQRNHWLKDNGFPVPKEK